MYLRRRQDRSSEYRCGTFAMKEDTSTCPSNSLDKVLPPSDPFDAITWGREPLPNVASKGYRNVRCYKHVVVVTGKKEDYIYRLYGPISVWRIHVDVCGLFSQSTHLPKSIVLTSFCGLRRVLHIDSIVIHRPRLEAVKQLLGIGSCRSDTNNNGCESKYL